MRLAVLAIGMSALPRAGGHRAVAGRPAAAGAESVRNCSRLTGQRMPLLDMRPAQPDREPSDSRAQPRHPARSSPRTDGDRLAEARRSGARPARTRPAVAQESQIRLQLSRSSSSPPPGRPAGPAADAPAAASTPAAPGPSPPRPGTRVDQRAADRCPSSRRTRVGEQMQSVAQPVPPAAAALTGVMVPRPARGAGHPIDRLPQPRRVGMQVNLRGTHRRMPEQFGDLIQGAARVNNVAGKGMSQLMRRYPAVQPGPPRAAATNTPTASGGIGAPIGSRNRLTITKSLAPAPGTAPLELVVVESLHHQEIQRHDPLPAGLRPRPVRVVPADHMQMRPRHLAAQRCESSSRCTSARRRPQTSPRRSPALAISSTISRSRADRQPATPPRSPHHWPGPPSSPAHATGAGPASATPSGRPRHAPRLAGHDRRPAHRSTAAAVRRRPGRDRVRDEPAYRGQHRIDPPRPAHRAARTRQHLPAPRTHPTPLARSGVPQPGDEQTQLLHPALPVPAGPCAPPQIQRDPTRIRPGRQLRTVPAQPHMSQERVRLGRPPPARHRAPSSTAPRTATSQGTPAPSNSSPAGNMNNYQPRAPQPRRCVANRPRVALRNVTQQSSQPRKTTVVVVVVFPVADDHPGPWVSDQNLLHSTG